MTNANDLLRMMINASIAAGKAILTVYDMADFGVKIKDDNSPLTLADLASSDVINSYLKKTGYPIISEEIKNQQFEARKDWETCWIVDPLDGTKEFVKRNGEFTVNIALCAHGAPTLGVIYVPVTRELYYANVKEEKAYKTVLDEHHSNPENLFNEKDRINPSMAQKKLLRVVGSRSHMNQDTLDYIAKAEESFDAIEIVSKGSSLKFCLVAEGKADVYPRFAPTMEWDTAAGHAICKAVGLKVTSQGTQEELQYNKKNLLNPYFLVEK